MNTLASRFGAPHARGFGAEPIAVVVGLCGHGLAVARALHRQGMMVVGIEKDPSAPGTSTNCARVVIASDINGDGMVEALLALPFLRRPHAPKPVLFLTNDRMVATIARRMAQVQVHFAVSWAGSAAPIERLLRKDAIEAQSLAAGLNYPKSRVVERAADLDAIDSSLAFPVIFKPAQPISAFKTIVAHSMAEVRRHEKLLVSCLPVVVQEFIPGDDSHIHFGALMLDEGRPVARFEGRKLRSRPMGHTTIAVSDRNDEVHRLAVQFFDGLAVSGPVSLELKRDHAGRFWVIEPTVGRTDFWLDVCVQNGVNLPLAEYFLSRRQTVPPAEQRDDVVWLNGQRDPYALLWLAVHFPSVALRRRLRSLFFDWADPAPAMRAIKHQLIQAGPLLIRRLGNRLRGRP